MKFGGSSLAPPDAEVEQIAASAGEPLPKNVCAAFRLLQEAVDLATVARFVEVARHIIETARSGRDVVVVVSAVGDTTDQLINLARAATPHPEARELDMLLTTGEQRSAALMAIVLNALGCPAISLTGGQAGIVTESVPGRALIRSVHPARIREELGRGKIVVVAGFQGVTEERASADITTLGRGGSDASATALAVALDAECDIYTDVPGVFTADPHVVPTAKLLPRLSYDEMLELASYGAKVLQARAVEIAARARIPLRVRSSFNLSNTGTAIGWYEETTMEEQPKIRALACEKNVAVVAIRKLPNRPGIAAAVFKALKEANVNVDIIVQPGEIAEPVDLSFSVAGADLERAYAAVKPVADSLGAPAVERFAQLAKVSVVGLGLQTTPGIAHQVFDTLAEAGINITAITTSEIRITCVIPEEEADRALQALHHSFGLQQ